MQQARGNLGVATVNGKIYAIGGSTYHGKWPATNGIVGTNEEYDPETDTWTSKKPMSTPRYGFAIAVYKNKIYCIGGKTSGGVTGVNEVYDPETDTWETKTLMPTARWLLQASVVNGKIYLIGGQNSGLSTKVNEVYDPLTDSWSMKAPIPTAVSNYASAVVDNKIYVVGGFFLSNLTQIYDPATDKWQLGATTHSSVSDGDAGVTIGVIAPKQIYVMGVEAYNGLGEPPCLNRVYDPEKDSWKAGADVPTNRLNFGVTVVDDKLYAIGGYVYNVLGFIAPSAVNEQYTPFGYGAVPPVVSVLSPENNKTYTVSNVSLTLTVNKPAVWLGYSLDGQDKVTIAGNITLSGLQNGVHNLTVYATDQYGNTGASETVYFSVEAPEPFPVVPVAAASGVAIASAAVCIYYYRKKRNH